MSVLKQALKEFAWLRGVLPVDVRVVADTVKHDDYDSILGREMEGCRSPFTSSITLPYELAALPQREGARICGWYEIGPISDDADDDMPFGVLLAEIVDEATETRRQIMQFFFQTRDRVRVLGDAVVNFNEKWGPDKLAVEIYHYQLPNLTPAQVLLLETAGRHMCYAAILSVCFANSLANCKNVKFEEDDSGWSASHRHASRKRKHKEHRGLTWRRLRIESRGGQRHAPTGSGGSHSEALNRWHLARGHFKTYTQEAPLLGKHVGRWWWAPQVRGSKDVGVVLKDYEINAGETVEADRHAGE